MRRLLYIGAIGGTMLLLLLAGAALLDWNNRFWMERPYAEDADPPTVTRVGVLGDAQKGLANLRNVARELRRQKVDLLLQTGDLVSNNDDGHYRLAAGFLRGAGFGMPLVAPGNHDLKGSPDRFLRWCGPLERSFNKGDVAYVLLNNAWGNPPPDPKHVEDRIAAAGPHQAVVLAMHQPPFDLQEHPKPEYAAFLAWLEKSKVDYLMCGHVHGYFRKKVGDTTVIVNGVGGDYDKWQFDQKVYATILDIDGTKISDRRIELEPVHEVWENIEHLAIGHVAEAYRGHPILCWGATVLLMAGVGGAIRKIIAFREPFKAPTG